MKKYFIAFLLFFSFQVQAMLLFECNMSREGAIATVKSWIFSAERGEVVPSFIVRKHKDQTQQEFIIPEMLSPRVVSAARTGGGPLCCCSGRSYEASCYRRASMWWNILGDSCMEELWK